MKVKRKVGRQETKLEGKDKESKSNRNVRIFGSVARGEADDRSDLEEALPPEGDGILK